MEFLESWRKNREKNRSLFGSEVIGTKIYYDALSFSYYTFIVNILIFSYTFSYFKVIKTIWKVNCLIVPNIIDLHNILLGTVWEGFDNNETLDLHNGLLAILSRNLKTINHFLKKRSGGNYSRYY